jgi:hypothetical protein
MHLDTKEVGLVSMFCVVLNFDLRSLNMYSSCGWIFFLIIFSVFGIKMLNSPVVS